MRCEVCTTGQEVTAIAIEQIETVIGRLSNDKAFRVKYCQDPDRTLETFLTPEEIRAIGCGQHWENLTAALCGPHPID
jgi:hypothetical protein